MNLVRALLVSVLVATTLSPAVSHAQGSDPLQRISADMTIIRSQLELALRYDRMALQMLVENGSSPDAVEEARRLATQAYVMARFAMGGLEMKLEGQKTFRRFKDPLVEMTRDKVVGAWNSTRGIIESGGVEAQIQYGQRAIERLEAALLLI